MMTKETVIAAIQKRGYDIYFNVNNIHVTPVNSFAKEAEMIDREYTDTPYMDHMELYLETRDTVPCKVSHSDVVGYIGTSEDYDPDYFNRDLTVFNITEVGVREDITDNELQKLLDQLPKPDENGYIVYPN